MNVGLTDLVLGSVSGLTYGVLALGLALIYKSGRFVNFAHGNLGAGARERPECAPVASDHPDTLA